MAQSFLVALVTAFAFVLTVAASGGAVAESQQSLAALYTAAAVASEQCGGRALTMLEETRLARVVRAESGEPMSPTQVTDMIASDRRLARADCSSPEVIENIRLFSVKVLSLLQTAIPLGNVVTRD